MSVSRRQFVARLMALPVAAHGLAGFSVFDVLDNTLPKDSGGVQIAKGVRFGPEPRHQLDVYAPRGLENPAPVILFIYGGAWQRGERHEYEFVGHALAARGFVTVVADYRLVPSVRYPSFVEDGALALKWIEAGIVPLGGDPKRLFLVGHSAGAYNAVMLALVPEFRRDLGVKISVRAVAGLSGPYNFYPFRVGEAEAAFGGVPNPEGTQPVNLVTAEAPAMFLATGTGDLIVRPSNTTLMAQALRRRRVPVTERYYDGLGHMDTVMALATLFRSRAPVLDEMVAFFNAQGAFNPASTEPPLLSP